MASEADFEEAIAKPLVMVKFSAQWCGPCKAVAPIIEKMEPSYPKITFVDVDVDKLSSVAQRFSVTSIPTFVFMSSGTETGRVLGGSIQEITKNLRLLDAKAPTFGNGNRVGGSTSSQRSISEIRELRTRALAKAAERREKPYSSQTPKLESKKTFVRPQSQSSNSFGQLLGNLKLYVQLYFVTLLSKHQQLHLLSENTDIYQLHMHLLFYVSLNYSLYFAG